MRAPTCRLDERRIGVAITVPDPWGSQLRQARASYGDIDATTVPTHITLVPPTCVPCSQPDVLEAHLVQAASQVKPFTVLLRGTGSFRPRSPVVFIQLVEGISGCEALHHHLLNGVLAQELVFPYHPHVTVAQEVPAAQLTAAAADWLNFTAEFAVAQIDLYSQDAQGVWQTEQSFCLGTGAKPASSGASQ
ncbi:MAG: 2'-5' RNA ligase family protein [Bifidobacteriaceae bacterium]|jgi:2'-5' RNA ligase|nr:2'-5' RNA ligase family protein [Bifidobacteriaceae bacterium]